MTRPQSAILLAIGVASCAGVSPVPKVATTELVTAEAAPRSTVAPPAVAVESFYVSDAIIEGLEPAIPWLFRQETWTADNVQHCRELGYPARLRAEIASTVNAALARRGIDGNLPDAVKAPHFGAVLFDFSSRLVVPSEPVIKLVLCSEDAMPLSNLPRLVEELRGWHMGVDELSVFGAPNSAWKREYPDHRRECGRVWLHCGSDKA